MSILKGDCNTGKPQQKSWVQQQIDDINETLEECRRLEAYYTVVLEHWKVFCCILGLSYSVGLSSSVGLS